ncbi:rhamnulokinase [Parabacteroides sp. PFB2-10]|uniref:rhamnulokinase n=1 Tax=Parabacteroides sp. PFB2-10 TaxID=1742405 RepID=UPI00247445EC|nr:rhamnulokinase family protein [Parabacteroides sp. PFB2-10]MDH6313112.1 rhamnulokinase [Parabacteroides sp. PFB2-10]MDL2244094.1 rhamnulokinase [Parabacteroides sp. OttesenSCG-928-J18]
MTQKHHFFALDLGATSGRSIIGRLENGKLELQELTRFPNTILRVQDKYYWNIYALYESLKEGLKTAAAKGIEIDSIGIDTWGVDFAYLAEDGSLINLPRSYRDPYTEGVPEAYFTRLSRQEVYDLTGIQIMNFNSLFQLYAAQREGSFAVRQAKNILFMPDALSYLLTGERYCEYTIASTSQIVNARTQKIDPLLLDVLDISPEVFPEVVMPGTKAGNVMESVARECGIGETPVIAVAGHDTASAVVAVPAEDENFAYLSSGTWSLMGIEVKEPIINEQTFAMNFTNEGGADGTIRFLKNITGMWLLEQCRKEWDKVGKSYSYPEIVALSDSAKPFRSLIDPDDASFANPESMLQAITAYCQRTNQPCPEEDAQFIRCIFDSLALKYKQVLNSLQEVAPFEIKKLHVIGGGSQNKLLNQMTANAIGIPVVAGPSEATAMGNIMIQAMGMGVVGSLQEIRDVIRNSVSPDVFVPTDNAIWSEAFAKFQTIQH